MNINQILNSALLNEGDDDEVGNTLEDENFKENKMLQGKQQQANNAPSTLDTAMDWVKTKPGIATASTLAALGAGLGAVALAKKLRAKKAQAKK